MPTPKPFKVLNEKTIFNQDQKFSIIQSDLKTPTGEKTTWSYIKAKDGVIVLPIDEDNNVHLVKQWRLNQKKEIWEVVSGWVDIKNASQKDLKNEANRELQEEIGFKSKNLLKLQTIYVTNQMSSRFHIFLARKLTPSVLKADEHEYIKTQKFPFYEAYKLITKNQTPNAQSLIAFLLAKEILKL